MAASKAGELDAGAMALFLDVDGTLIDFAASPDEAAAPPELPGILAAARRRVGGALALVSGRSIAELDRLMAPLQLPASGLHGAEIRLVPGGAFNTPDILSAALVDALRGELTRYPGARFEDKGASVAIHYRAAPHLAPELHQLLTRYLGRAEGPPLELMVGELVYELKPPGFDKGTAIAAFMQRAPFAGRQPVFCRRSSHRPCGIRQSFRTWRLWAVGRPVITWRRLLVSRHSGGARLVEGPGMSAGASLERCSAKEATCPRG